MAAVALGYSLRLPQELQDSSRQLIESAAQEEHARAAAAASEERAAIARELHDSLGHHATVVSMHSDVVREAAASESSTVKDSAQIIKGTSQEMLTELRRTVQALRGANPSSARQIPSLDPGFLQTNIFEPLPVQVHADIQVVEQPPPAVQSAAHRILQESLTNVVRHSMADTASVTVLGSPSEVHLIITDPGPARAEPERTPGYGIAGMRERAEALGGSLRAASDGEGFTVEARLPIPSHEENS
ncbi:sensor histidine kinase [Nesterenkonia flava]|uniref:histidine kinase n=1 Tax=Nesterenkonia flava TaxID=469799 RepID=A0ABU1FR94_9MICC|nr:histidine kinase [Nesterenkonia flava]MDR5711164.1 histidine kinase [Nesterenkonia flava]